MTDFSYNANKIDLQPIIEQFNRVVKATNRKESYISQRVFGNGNRFKEIELGESELTPRVHNRAWERLEEIMVKHQAKQQPKQEATPHE